MIGPFTLLDDGTTLSGVGAIGRGEEIGADMMLQAVAMLAVVGGPSVALAMMLAAVVQAILWSSVVSFEFISEGWTVLAVYRLQQTGRVSLSPVAKKTASFFRDLQTLESEFRGAMFQLQVRQL